MESVLGFREFGFGFRALEFGFRALECEFKLRTESERSERREENVSEKARASVQNRERT